MRRRVRTALLTLAIVGCRERSPGAASVSLAARLLADSVTRWHDTTIVGTRLHFARGSAADSQATAVAESVTVIRRELRKRLGATSDSQTADLFFLGTRDEMRRLSQRPLAGFVQQAEPTGVFVVSRGYHYGSLLRHELTHLYTFELWGTPRAGRWLVEGVAAWMAGTCQRHTNDALAAGVLVNDAFVSLTQLAQQFERTAEDVAMPEAGSAVGYLVQNEGLEAAKTLWQQSAPVGHPLGERGSAFEAAWRDEVRRAKPAKLDVPRLMIEGC